MVTIEEKLALFSKLLQQKIKEDVEYESDLLEEEYEKKIKEKVEWAKKEANERINHAKKRAEAHAVKELSVARLNAKKEQMKLTESFLDKFIGELIQKIEVFGTTPEYKVYLEKLIDTIDQVEESTEVTVKMRMADVDEYEAFVKERLETRGFHPDNIQIMVSNTQLLGGMVISFAEDNTQLDLSIKRRLEESKDLINQSIFENLSKEVS